MDFSLAFATEVTVSPHKIQLLMLKAMQMLQPFL